MFPDDRVCLSQWNVTSAAASGSAVAYIADQRKYLSECYASCDDRFGVGIALDDGDPFGSVAVHANRLSAAANDLSVSFSPAAKWMGLDTFTYSVLVGVGVSPTYGTVRVHVCRSNACMKGIHDDVALATGS